MCNDDDDHDKVGLNRLQKPFVNAFMCDPDHNTLFVRLIVCGYALHMSWFPFFLQVKKQ